MYPSWIAWMSVPSACSHVTEPPPKFTVTAAPLALKPLVPPVSWMEPAPAPSVRGTLKLVSKTPPLRFTLPADGSAAAAVTRNTPPLIVVFPISLSSAAYMQFPPPGLSWQWYERFLDDPQWIDATWRSLYIGVATAALALALGVPLAFSLVRAKFAGRSLIDRLALAPLIVPTIVFSVSIYGLFAKLKLIGEWYGLVLAHTALALPFVVLVMGAGLRDFDRSLEQAAEGLGAGRWSILLRVTLPLLRPYVEGGMKFFVAKVDPTKVKFEGKDRKSTRLNSSHRT